MFVQFIFPPPPSSAAVIIAALHILNGYPLRLPAAGDLAAHRIVEVHRSAVNIHAQCLSRLINRLVAYIVCLSSSVCGHCCGYRL